MPRGDLAARLRDREEQLLAVIIAAVAFLAISAVVLKPLRQQASAALADRVDQRVERKRDVGGDEAAEDGEQERPEVSRPASA